MWICSRALLSSVAAALLVSSANAAVFQDGDFSTWNFSSFGFGSATMSREASGGDPGARLNVTTDTSGNTTAFGTGVNPGFATNAPLEGDSFTLTLDVLSGAGAFGQGQAVQLLVEQNGSIYGLPLGITGVQGTFTGLNFPGTFTAASFTLEIGSGPANPTFDGSVVTHFGFAAGNTNSPTLTQYYDNFRLDVPALPGGAAIAAPTLSPFALFCLAVLLVVVGGMRGPWGHVTA